MLVVVITLLYPVINYPMLSAMNTLINLMPLPACIDYRKQFFRWRFNRLFISAIGMVAIVLLNLQFNSLVSLFGLCGAYGLGFVCYVIPSMVYAVHTPPGKGKSIFIRIMAVFSACVMLTIVVGYTITLFE